MQVARLDRAIVSALAVVALLAPHRADAQAQKKLAVLQFTTSKGVSVERENFSQRLQNAAKKASLHRRAQRRGRSES